MSDDMDDDGDDRATKQSRRKLMVDTASKVVNVITSVCDEHDDIHYVLELVHVMLGHEEPCPENGGNC